MADRIEKLILDTIDSNRDRIIEFARDIYDHGELGYKEFRTAGKFVELLEALNLTVKEGLAITGAKGYLNQEKKENITLALIGEYDALKIPNHPHYNGDSCGAHACGHHAQLAGVIGAAIALSQEEVKDNLHGQVIFFGVPAEEYGEIAYKNMLMEEDKIQYGGGKCELIRIGAFDEVDISIVHHTHKGDIQVGSGSNNGFVSKVISYRGRAAHAAGAPEKGINALNAASLGLTALGYQRETFRDEDNIRVHPILTKGGDLVNVVPEEAVIETLVRGNNIRAITDADAKVNRAFFAGAMAMGATCKITTMPGYLPTIPNQADDSVLSAARLAASNKYTVEEANLSEHSSASTDVGDLDHIQPVLKFSTGGMKSELHASDFDIVDEELAYIVTAKIFALTAYHLLKDKAIKAKDIRDKFEPNFTKEEYISYMNSFKKTEVYES